MKKFISVIVLLIVGATALAADLNGELRINLESHNSHTTLKYDKTVLSLSGNLQANTIKVAVDLEETNIAVAEAYIKMGSIVVGKYKTPFGIGNYGIKTPLAVRNWNGERVMGLWLMGQASMPAEYIVGFLNNQSQEMGKRQVGWLKYKLNKDLSLYGSLLNKEDGKTICSLGGLYLAGDLEFSGEYIAGQSEGDISGILLKGQYTVAPAWDLYGIFSQINKNANNNPAEYREIIVGSKYSIARGLDWETEYMIDSDEGQNKFFVSRLKARF